MLYRETRFDNRRSPESQPESMALDDDYNDDSDVLVDDKDDDVDDTKQQQQKVLFKRVCMSTSMSQKCNATFIRLSATMLLLSLTKKKLKILQTEKYQQLAE